MQYFYVVFHKTKMSSQPEHEVSLKQREELSHSLKQCKKNIYTALKYIEELIDN